MKVSKENSNYVTIEFDKNDFNNIRNFFITNNQEEIKSMCTKSEFKSIEKLVYLEDVDKGLFDELSRVLDEDMRKNLLLKQNTEYIEKQG